MMDWTPPPPLACSLTPIHAPTPFSEDKLRGALADLVNGISRCDAAEVWGHARTSSSDGQRYLFPRKTLKATYSHRLGDYALEFYTFVADNYAPFYSTPIECTERDAAYVLDGLLYHESEIDPEEHYTGTHGYTELNFAAFAMFGKRFCPRIRGLHRQWIYRIDPDKGSAHIRVEIQNIRTRSLADPGTIEDVPWP